MRSRSAVPLVALLFGLVACTGEGGSPAQTGTTRPPSASATTPPKAPDGVPVPFGISARLDTKDARTASPGREYRVSFVSDADTPGNRTLSVLDLTSAGGLVAAANPRPRTGEGELAIGQSAVGLHGGKGFTPFPRAKKTCSNTPRQAVYADERDGVVTWTESASTNLYFFDWCVFAYSPETRRTALLGDSSSLTKGKEVPEAPGSSAPSIGKDKAYWAVTYPTSGKRDVGVKIVARPLSGEGEMETVTERGKLPKATADGALYFVRSEDVSPGFAKDRYEIHRVTPEGSEATVTYGHLAPGQQVTALAVAGTSVNWVVSSEEQGSSVLYSLNTATNRAVTFELGHTGPPTMFLRATPERLAWGNGSATGDAGQYVYDFARGRLWRVGSEEGFSVMYAKGDHLAWSQLPETGAPGSASFNVTRWER